MTSNITPTPETLGKDLNAQRAALVPPNADEQQKIVSPDTPWTDSRAKETAKRNFERAFQFTSQNYFRAFRKCDDVLMAVTKQKTWQGTKIARASIPIWMGIQQIEALLPHAIGALFADDFPFECLPKVGTSLQQAVQIRDLLKDQIEDLNPDIMGMTLREIVRRAYKSDYIYGAAPIEFGWLMKQVSRLRYERKLVPERTLIPHPITGEPVPAPTGRMIPQVLRDVHQYQVSRPKVQNLSVWEFFIDPNCNSHNPQEAQYASTRQLLPISYLKQVCLPEFGFNLPNDKDLYELSKLSKQTMAEVTKQWKELDRGNYWNSGAEYSIDGGDQRIEVVRYWSKDRHVWLLGRDWLAYNETNELGVLPFLNPFYIDLPGRFYGLSICDLIEGDQKLAQAVIEARIDELNLMIHPPIIRTMGSKTSASQKRLSPGVEWEVDTDDARKGVARMDMGNVTQGAYIEVQALEQRVQKTTGVTDLAALGAPATGGNSANRTATGINTQSAATGIRIQYQVENGEDQFIGPLLQMLLLLNQKYTDPESNQILLATADGQVQQIDPLDVLNADVKFKIKASDKLRIRRAMAGGGLEAVLQFLQAVAGEQLLMQGVQINWQTVGQLIADTLGLPANDLFTAADPQMVQQMMAQKTAPDNIRMQMQRERLASAESNQQESNETKLLTALINHLLTPDAAHEALGLPAPAAIAAKHAPKPQPQGGKK